MSKRNKNVTSTAIPAATKAARHRDMEIAEADLSSISDLQFVTLSQLFNGLGTAPTCDSRSKLLHAIYFALAEQNRFREDISGRQFVNNTPENRAEFMQKIDRERQHLNELSTAIEKLDDAAGLAVLTRIEEVYASDDEALYDRCIAVYQKMRRRDRL